MTPKSPGWPGLILSGRFTDTGMNRTEDGRVGGRTIDSRWRWRSGALGGEKVGRKGEGQARANRLSSRGFCAGFRVPGSLRRFFFLPSTIFFLHLRVYRPLSLSLSPGPVRPILVPVTSIPRQCGIIPHREIFRSPFDPEAAAAAGRFVSDRTINYQRAPPPRVPSAPKAADDDVICNEIAECKET